MNHSTVRPFIKNRLSEFYCLEKSCHESDQPWTLSVAALDWTKKNLGEPGRVGELIRTTCVLGAFRGMSCEKEPNPEFTVRLLRQWTHHLSQTVFSKHGMLAEKKTRSACNFCPNDPKQIATLLSLFFFFFFFFSLFRAAPAAYGSSQARGRMGAAAAGLTPQPQQHGVLNPLSRARDRTQVLMDTSWVRYQWATMWTLSLLFISKKRMKPLDHWIVLKNKMTLTIHFQLPEYYSLNRQALSIISLVF